MSKAPILLLGGAAVIVAIVATQKSSTASTSNVKAAAAPPKPQGKSLQSLTSTQKSKLESWAKSKGVPVQKAYDLAQSLFTTEF